VNRKGAKSAVAAAIGLTEADFQARPAGGGAWYVWERDIMKMPIDDQVWAVLPSGKVIRAVADGHPWLLATDLTGDFEERWDDQG
jgi:hypothetical protein